MLRALLLIALMACAVAASASVHTIPYKAELRLHPFSDLPQAPFAWIDGATVSIEFGYASGYDRLMFDYAGKFNITASFNAVNGVLYLRGEATASEYTNAISSVVFYTTSRDGARRQLTYSFGSDTFYFSLTEHYYRYYNVPGLKWPDAAARCAASSYFNISGYLATVNSQDEQMELSMVATFNAWLGGNDKQVFSQYRWVTGPDGDLAANNGPLFWTGQSQYVDGVAPENVFTAWNRFQPENPQGSGKDYVYLVNSADQDTSYWGVAGDGDLIDGYICEYGSPAVSMLSTNMGGSIELVQSCGMYATQSECSAESNHGCAWVTSASQCVQTTCSKYSSQVNCEADNACSWNVEGSIGQCVGTPCGSLAGDVCAANPQCVVDGGGVGCRNAVCSDRTSACSCNAQDGCSWRNNVCGNVNTLDCDGEDVVFLIDGSTIMKDTFGRYPNAFYGLTDTLKDTPFLFNGKPASTMYQGTTFGQRVGVIAFGASNLMPGGTGRLTSSRSEWLSDLSWMQQNFAPQSAGRSIRTALTAAAQLFANSLNRTKTIAIVAAGSITDAQSIAQAYTTKAAVGDVLSLLQTIGVKVVGVALSASSSRTEDSVAALQSLGYLTDERYPQAVSSATIRQLQSQFYYGMCDGTSLAAYVQPAGKSWRCEAYNDSVSCNADAQCAWNTANAQCSNNGCLSYCSKDACDVDMACSWDVTESRCLGACALLGENACLASLACTYDYRINSPIGLCVNRPCLANPTEDACIADSGCTWNPGAATPCSPTPCNTADPTACAKEEGCVFTGSLCVVDPCRALTDVGSCRNLPQCEWKSSANLCQRNTCGMRVSESDCVATDECQWNMTVVPAACGPAPCTSYNSNPQTAQILCQRNAAQCLWSTAGIQPRCIVKECELMTESCTCAQLPNCVWRNATCKQNQFVQCPGTDVVFLVEATPVMLEPFGRHPNGFIGIVEAIRSWSQAAPFSADVSATGFRFAMVMYGQSKSARSVPSDVGGGGNLTSSRDQWLGAGQELNWMLDNFETYARSGLSGSAALRPALAQALQIFQNSPGVGRKQLTVIVGNSPVTDGGSEMLREITQLESMGVQIFANVVRRFSYVTPVDTLSAEYMSPIASDPPSVFFSFTTIDTMQDTLLENFCDPSSPTGKVLQISRNGEFPCSWLEGKDECNLQGSCMWDASATKTCPSAGQCPSLNCQTLPPALDNLYDCEHCQLQSGAISCSRANPAPAVRGLCVKSSCATTCRTGCNTDCAWDEASTRCERDMCTPLKTMTDCNSNQGCVYQMDISGGGAPAKCVKSICARYRDQNTCIAFSVSEAGSAYDACFVNKTTTPAICVTKRCPDLDAATCESPAAGGMCAYSPASQPRTCLQKRCQYFNAESCEFDANCFWDPFTTTCLARTPSCVLSGYSDWAPCSATCGPAITYKSRAILQFPNGGATCQQVASVDCSTSFPTTCASSDRNLTVVQSCTNGVPPAYASAGHWVPPFKGLDSASEWSSSCALHCEQKATRQDCIFDSACRWIGSRCEVKPFLGCQVLTQTECDASDMCAFDAVYSLCRPAVESCQYLTQTQCNLVSPCSWRTGATSMTLAASMGVPLQLYNPGQPDIFPFDGLEASSSTMIDGATVTIETNYQRGKDVLQSTYTQTVTGNWMESAGTLIFSGRASVSEYMKTIRFITFSTTSTRTVPRTISWSLGNSTAFCSATKHHYRVFENIGATYSFAVAACARQELYGLRGYLATITSAAENDIAATKLTGDGWISGSDALGKTWVLTTGPEGIAKQAFWTGPAASLGGQAASGAYTNWAPPNNTNLYGEPIINTGLGGTTGNDRVYMARTGFWESRMFDANNSNGYICEYGGMTDDAPPTDFALGGSAIVGIGGCVAQSCVWHATQELCNLDIECAWTNGKCEPGCSARSTENECTQSTNCRWDASVLPPVCDVNPCTPLAQAACAANSRCVYDQNEGCRMRQGCGEFNEANCAGYPTCMWNGVWCVERGCATFTTLTECRAIPRCRWDDSSSACLDQYCMFPTEALCATDAGRCNWNEPTDARSVLFSPNNGGVYPFKTSSPNLDINTVVDGFTVAIAAGFQPNADRLTLDLSADDMMNWQWTFDGVSGVLSCNVAPGVRIVAADAWLLMANSVKFQTTSGSIDARRINYVLAANAVFSVTSNTFYRWFPTAAPTSQADAQTFCRSKALFDLAGNLAIIENEMEQQRLRQAGAFGWTAGMSNSNGVFVWFTASSSSAPAVFWNGTGRLSTPVTVTDAAANSTGPQYVFAQWDLNQPSVVNSFVYLESTGFWKSVAAVSSKTGVLCEYGSQTVQSNFVIGGFRTAEPAGCFIGQCKPLTISQCGAQKQCRWVNNACSRDLRCAPGQTMPQCGRLAGCYWDYDSSMCISTPPTTCSPYYSMATCNAATGCEWDSNLLNAEIGKAGACVGSGCGVHPAESPCLADPRCKWSSGTCTARLCGYSTSRDCWRDPSCNWETTTTTAQCVSSSCVQFTTEPACNAADSCGWDSTKSTCNYVRCATRQGLQTCLADKGCIFKSGSCQLPACFSNMTEQTCNSKPDCFFFVQSKTCSAAQCVSYSDQGSCEGAQTVTSLKQCIWTGSNCRQLTIQEQNAPANSCEKQVNPNMWWLWCFLVVILILLVLILHRLWLAHAGNLNFFEATRKNYKYNPHEKYAAALVDHAAEREEETNVQV